MPQNSKKEHIIDVATELFYTRGFNSTGVERVRDAAGISKKTLYNHFHSKEELVLAVLRRNDEAVRHWLVKSLDETGNDPKKKLIGIFELYAGWMETEAFQGCMFIKAASEFSDPESRCKAACFEAKRLYRQEVRRVIETLGVVDVDDLAARIDLLVQGATVQAYVAGDKNAIHVAKAMAVEAIDNAIVNTVTNEPG